MKAITHTFTALLLLTVPAFVRAAPVELGCESFETAPGIGYTTSTPEFDDAALPNSDFFGRFPNDGCPHAGGISVGDGSLLTTGNNTNFPGIAFTELLPGKAPDLSEAVDGDMDDAGHLRQCALRR